MRRLTTVVWSLAVAAAWAGPAAPAAPEWPGAEMPLPLAVRTAEDLQFKAALERQYLIFNLLGAGKIAWDKGDWATASAKWDALLRVPGLPLEVDALVRPMLVTARSRSGKAGAELPPPPGPTPRPVAAGGAEVESGASGASGTSRAEGQKAGAPGQVATVAGVLTGGGKLGPGGSVVFLKRLDGSTPKPKQGRPRVVEQKDKRFAPRVLAVTVGTQVEFKNLDPVFHNVFSLSRPNDFDLGLYRGGLSKDKVFTVPGAVQVLCNIHASMLGWVFVVDTPWFAQADADGKFAVKGVPPGEYKLSVWHENASRLAERTVKVTDKGLDALALNIEADKAPAAFVPDKAGKPRQPQLGY